MRTSRLLFGALLAASTAGAPSCADPTAIEVTVYSEVPCATNAEVALLTASSGDGLANAAPAAVATLCETMSDGTVRRGNVVLTPITDRSKLVAFELQTRKDGQPNDSCKSDPAGCIVARRELRFQPHATVELRVDLRLSCLGVACPADQTCVKGSCVGASVPASCGAACDENALQSGPDAGAPDTSVPDTSVPDTSVPDSSPPPTVTLAAGGSHVCAVIPGAVTTIKCWGDSTYGQVGDGKTVNRSSPTVVASTPLGGSIGLGWDASYAAFSDGSALAWGRNTSGELGLGTLGAPVPTPTQLTSPKKFQRVSGGSTHACGLDTAGGLACWGDGSQGQVGTMVGQVANSPLAVPGLSKVLGFALGDLFTCAWTSVDARCFGTNNVGQLGHGAGAGTATPTVVSNLGAAPIKSMSAGSDNACAILGDGSVSCWGDNSSGECGDGVSGGQRLTPVAVKGLPKTATMLAGGGPHMCALLSDGTVWCWGNNGSGQLGDGSVSSRPTPAAATGVSNATWIASTNGGTCAVIGGKSVVCWGGNASGEIGDGTTTQRTTAVAVVGL